MISSSLKFGVIGMFLISAAPALAGLGDHIDLSNTTVPAPPTPTEGRSLVGTSRSASSSIGSLYRIRETQVNGNTIREYVSPSGVVFAISWNGITTPDLGPLLGSYFPEFDAAAAGQRRLKGRHPVAVQTSNVIVLKGGKMRNRFGRAYVPSLMPAGLTIEDIAE